MISDWGQAFLKAISDAFSKLFSFIPDLIGALLILWIGFFIAKLLGRLTADILRKIRFNQAADKAGVSRFAQSAGIRKDASGIAGEIVKWFFRLIALIAAVNVFQLPALTLALAGILNFIPKLAVALVIMLIGGLIANVAAEFVQGAVGQSKIGNSRMYSNIVRYVVLYIAGITALSQLDIAPAVIDTLWIGTIAALALALGLAFGLGGRDVASRMLESGYNKAQENLPKLAEGAKQHTRQQQSIQAQPRPNNGGAQIYNPAPAPAAPQPTSGYAASAYTQPIPRPQQPGTYQGQGGYQQPQAPQQPGGYYGQGEYRVNDQPQPGRDDNYPRSNYPQP